MVSRVSPGPWRKESDSKLKYLRFEHDGVMYKFNRSHFDTSLRTIHEDNGCDFLHQILLAGYLLSYVDDFLVAGEARLRVRLEEEVARIWKEKAIGCLEQMYDGHVEH